MDSSKIQREADSDNCAESDMSSISDTSSENDDRAEAEPKKNKMKLRSFKLSRLPSLRSCVRPIKSQSSKCPDASSEQSTPKESLQKSAGSSFKHMKSLAKMSSMQFRRPLIRKPSGDTDLTKQKLKKTKPTSYVDTSTSYSKADSSGAACKRTATVKSEISDSSIVRRATCSSALKDAKLPHRVEGSESEGVSGMKVCSYSYCSLHGHRHGGHDTLPPLKRFVSMRRRSLKSQKSTKPESRSVPKVVKRSKSRRKGAQTSQMIFDGEDSADQETAQTRRKKSSGTENVLKTKFKGSDSHGGESTGIGDSENLSEILLSETSHPYSKTKHCDNLSLRHNSVLSARPEESPVDAKVLEEFNGDTVEVSEASRVTSIINEEKPEESVPSNDLQEGFSQSGDNMPNFTADQSQKLEKQKHSGLWGLIYRHMASGIAREDENELPRDGKDEAGQVSDGCSVPQKNDSVSVKNSCGAYENMGMGHHNAGDEKFELWQRQSYAIKLVQEAFDKILSEIPDQSSDDQSATSEVTSEQELSESAAKGQVEPQEADINNTVEEEQATSEEGNNSGQKISKNWNNLKKVIILKRFVKALERVNKINPCKPRVLPIEADPETEKVNLRHQTVKERKNADEWMLDYALQQVVSKLAPAQKRKVALLVQAFETVSPLPKNSTHLTSNATASSHSTPLQASTDCCNQRGDQNDSGSLHKASFPEMSVRHTADQVSDFPAVERHIQGICSELKGRSSGYSCSNTAVDLLASETTPENLQEGEKETVTFISVKGENNPTLADDRPVLSDVTSTNPEELRMPGEPSSKPENSKSTSNYRNILLEVKEVPLTHASEFHDRDIKIDSRELVTNAASEQLWQPKSSTLESVISSASFSELLEEPGATCRDEANTKYEVPQKFSPPEKSEPTDTIDIAQDSKLEKQKYMRLWYLLHKHMVSGTGTQLIPEDSHKEEQGSNENALSGKINCGSCKDSPHMNQKLVDNQNTSCQNIECEQIEAIKIIEEAIDEIPLPHIQDDLMDDSPVTGNVITDPEVEEEHSENGELLISTSKGSTKDSFRESNTTKVENEKTADPREATLNSNNILTTEESEAFSESYQPKPQVRKNWSNLKKVILLKRFIKSLEKVRKFNPREPRYLPLGPEKGAEKVHLRHQSMEGRKNIEEWMLDHALQQVVAKLTPARKRKVELLVEAFETVTPMLEVKAGQKHSPAVSPQPSPINA